MKRDLAFGCECGELRGVLRDVTPTAGNHLVCYCDDCQSFAHFLGHAEKTLDSHGGTDIFQTSPARLELTQGSDELACLRLRPGGLVRWYARCCNTPIGNTLASAGLPFVGVIRRCVENEGSAAALGPIRGGVQAKFARGEQRPPNARDGAFGPIVFRFLRVLLVAKLRGDQRRSPFFDPSTGALVAKPHVLSSEELRAAEASRDSFEPGGETS